VSSEKPTFAEQMPEPRTGQKEKACGAGHIGSFLVGIALVMTLLVGSLLFALVTLRIPDLSSVADYRPA
jgi:hypothetical protein